MPRKTVQHWKDSTRKNKASMRPRPDAAENLAAGRLSIGADAPLQ